jgi:IMP dehydrogenase
VIEVEIGAGKSARRGYGLDEIAIVPSRRTRDASEIDISWRLDAYKFDLPFLASPSDAVVSPSTASAIGVLGGLGVLNLEGLWTRYEDPTALLAEIARLDPRTATPRLQAIYAEPVKPTLVLERIEEIRSSGAIACGALRPQRAQELAETLLRAELDILVIQGTVVSAEHVAKAGEPLNLKTFIRQLDIPIVVGGCSSFRTALHLMRTGAVGVLVGAGAAGTGTTRSVLGIGSPEATAIADAAGARTRHLEETGVYVQVVADATLRRGGDIAKAIACGADAVMLGEALARATDSAAPGATWGTAAWHATLPRGGVEPVTPSGTIEEILVGPGREGDGELNLFGALRASMSMCGAATIREFQRSEIVVVPPLDGAEHVGHASF